MEEIAFGEWPGQPVDLNAGNNPWLPAYGYQPPRPITLLEREDFLGNPDADYFLPSNCTSSAGDGGSAMDSGHYTYLETILEETSDDLRSDDSDSEVASRCSHSAAGWLATDSETGSVIRMDTTDDLGCESDRELACPAKRRKQDCFLALPNAEEDLSSLSRSSSLVQFETLEKQCQETCSSSPSVYSQFSFDSLEARSQVKTVSPDKLNEVDYYGTLKVDVPVRKRAADGSESGSSDGTLSNSRSCDNLKTWRSFDSLPVSSKSVKEKNSAENLSEDSGYSDHMTKSSSASNLKEKEDRNSVGRLKEGRKGRVGFAAYDGEVFTHEQISGNFGVSYRDLTILDTLKATVATTEHFSKRPHRAVAVTRSLKLTNPECRTAEDNFSRTSCSEPDLLLHAADSVAPSASCGCSVPKDLNYLLEEPELASVAVNDWNLADLLIMETSYKREGSYAEAMTNRVDLSDDEHSLVNRRKPKLPKTPIVEFDKRVLKAISEQSLQSVQNLCAFAEERSIVSTPNLAALNRSEPDKSHFDEDRRRSVHDVRRKGSIIKSSTSTSGLSDAEERTLSYAGSTSSKGVHFSPVVSEVNWRDSSVSTVTPDRESSVYSLDSSTPERRASPVKETGQTNAKRLAYSQPNLSDNDESCKREFEDSLRSLRQADHSKSQPDVSRLRRRGSQLMKKDRDGAVVRAYVDADGVQYRHTHLDQALLGSPAAANPFGGSSTIAAAKQAIVTGSVVAMQSVSSHLRDPHQHHQRKKPGRIGGFFQRLTRFSLRKGDGEKKKKTDGNVQFDANTNGANVLLAPQQRLATKSDYIYIPLKGPPGADSITANAQQAPRQANGGSTGAAATAKKPPLPKQPPPRVVHVSVKQGSRAALAASDNNSPSLSSLTAQQSPQSGAAGGGRAHVAGGGGGHQRHHQHRRHRTIDGGGGSHSATAPALGVQLRQMDHADALQVGGLLETDIDTQVTVVTTNGAKARSLLDLGDGRAGNGRGQQQSLQTGEERRDRPHKSMEFLLDKENLKVVEPPENELQKGERVMSEQQLRVQRSLQKLTVPDWYRRSQVPGEGFLLKKNSSRETRWTGTAGSKTTSLSSLGSNTHSPVVLSPTPCNQPFVRWSTSKLNSTASSPCASTRSSFNAPRQPNGSISPSSVRSSFSYRQPYLGWRSQERLNRPRTPAERLASSLLNSQSSVSQQAPLQASPEIQTSIKEVTSAIVHYVSGLHPPQDYASDSASPRGSQGRLCWLESSFVGSRPAESPETPLAIPGGGDAHTSPAQTTTATTGGLRLQLQAHNGKSTPAATTAASS